HVEYLFKVFDFDAAAGAFREATLENMIDRDRILKSKDLRAKFTEWFFQPETLRRFDAGTIVIPEEYLAKRAFSVAPGGQSRSFNRPFFEMFSDEQIEKALAGQSLRNIRSVDGFHRRASDITCIGCHQTRAIGGFHFMGRDPLLKYPGNSVFVPGSTHFFGDLPRRKDIVAAFALNQSPDFSRGFSSRPQESRSRELVGRGLYDGWGAHCFKGADASFASWTCAAGLRCQTLHDSRFEIGMGVCVPDGRLEIGDALERGVVTTRRFGDDRYKASDRTKNPDPGRYVTSPQSAEPGKSTGGFPAGSLRTKTCDNLPGQAVCGALPAAANGFNACVGSGKNFVVCLREFSAGVGLRGCDADNPCRDDYICAESYDANKGACVPPYFLFQFRVDGHPVGKAK
nr:hypothetical protein [Bdellovibrionales bacterium]